MNKYSSGFQPYSPLSTLISPPLVCFVNATSPDIFCFASGTKSDLSEKVFKQIATLDSLIESLHIYAENVDFGVGEFVDFTLPRKIRNEDLYILFFEYFSYSISKKAKLFFINYLSSVSFGATFDFEKTFVKNTLKSNVLLEVEFSLNTIQIWNDSNFNRLIRDSYDGGIKNFYLDRAVKGLGK